MKGGENADSRTQVETYLSFSATVLLCFKDILKKCGQKPQRVQTDRGTEFICKTLAESKVAG